MALNMWWTADPAERYWMEITHRPDIGGNLQAPKLVEGQWSYDLVSQVQPGDRVLHWSGVDRALVGWSDVIGSAGFPANGLAVLHAFQVSAAMSGGVQARVQPFRLGVL
jgi:hypothetical protein